MSNHNGNANKMVDTPRTEAEVNRQKCWSDDLITIDANFACQLERELNAANQRIKRLEEESESNWRLAESAIGSCAEMSSRIKRLEEAGDKIVEAGWSVQDWSGMCVVWAKAKEAKP